ncbi:MAG TPA: AI-2E family transporter [Ktedonobacteraceae bacterium]
MSSSPDQSTIPHIEAASTLRWQRRFLMALTVLAWIVTAGLIIWGIGLIIEPVILLVISALLAYLFYPVVQLFQRIMPRALAISISLLLVLGVLCFLLYTVLVATVQQLVALIHALQVFIADPASASRFQPVIHFLNHSGIPPNSFDGSAQQLLAFLLQNTLFNALPLVRSVLHLFITGIVILSLTVYFMIDGYRVNRWLRNKTPVKFRGRINLFMNVVEKSLGSFVRGQVLLAFIMSVIIGVGAYFIGVPYVFLLSVIVFVFECVPVIGAYISGTIGILFALSVGWQTALIYGIFVVLMQVVLDGQVLAPRIIGNSVGLHSIISIAALLIGASLFGLFGALFSAPIAGIIQVFVLAFWATWREQHPDQFPEERKSEASESKASLDEHEQTMVGT